MTKNCCSKLRRAGVMAAVAAVASTGAFAQNLELDTVAPDEAPHNQPTEIVLEGTFNTNELDNLEVFFSETGVTNPATDAKGVVQSATGTTIVAITPRVDAATDSNVYVALDTKQSPTRSNTLEFTFTGGTLNNTRALASALQDEFDDADTDNDGTISFDEAEALIPGITEAEFDALDGNGDGELTEAELAEVIAGTDCFPGGLGAILGLGLVGFLLAIWDQIRRRLFGSTHSWVPDVDQRHNSN